MHDKIKPWKVIDRNRAVQVNYMELILKKKKSMDRLSFLRYCETLVQPVHWEIEVNVFEIFDHTRDCHLFMEYDVIALNG